MQETTKAMTTGKEEKSQINNLGPHHKNLEKEKQNKPKMRRQEIILKINRTGNKNTMAKIIKQRADSEKINKIDKPLARLTKGE